MNVQHLDERIALAVDLSLDVSTNQINEGQSVTVYGNFTSTATDSGPAATTLPVLNGLQLWLDAADPATILGGATVSTWLDKSGLNNHATQGNVANQPVVNATAMNGRPAIRFDGAGDGLSIANTLNVNAQYTIFTVDQYYGGLRGRTLQSSSGANWLTGKWNNSNANYNGNFVYLGTAGQGGTYPAIGVATNNNVGNNTGSSYYLNGANRTQQTATVGVPGNLGLGSSGTFNEQSQADISEIIVYNRVLNDTERQAVEQYLAAKYSTALVGVFTGGDVGEGLDLDGNFVYALNMRGPGGFSIRDANFTTDGAAPHAAVPGVTTVSQNEALVWSSPNYGASANDNNLEIIDQSIRWSANPNSISVDLANLTVGQKYKLQLLFHDPTYDRYMDVFAEGNKIFDDFSARVFQGVGNNTRGVVLTWEYTATDTTLNLLLTPPGFAAADQNPLLHGLTLEALPAVVPAGHTATVDWGDGSAPQVVNVPAGQRTFSVTKTYTDDNPTATPSDTNNISVTLNGGVAGIQTASTSTIGDALIDRAANDGAVGYIFSNMQAFTTNGTVTRWSFFDNDGAGRTLTPIILEEVAGNYHIRGVGTPRVSNGSGVQSFNFDLIAGSAAVKANYYIAWKDGSTTADNAGVADYSPGAAVNGGVRYFAAPHANNVKPGRSLGAGTFDNRDYSVQFTTNAIQVDNVQPLLTALAIAPSVDEGTSVDLTGTITDPGTGDSFSITVDWGDGNVEVVPLPAGTVNFSIPHTYDDDDPPGTLSDPYTVTVTALTDDDGGSAFYGPRVAATTPTAYWRLNDVAGNFADSSGNGWTATAFNTVPADYGVPGALNNQQDNAVNFDGNNYARLPHQVFANWVTGGPLTFEAWFNTTTSGVILGHTGAGSTPGVGGASGWVPSVYVGTDGRVRSEMFWHGSVNPITTAGTYNDGQWHHVVNVFNHNLGTETLYIDGVAVGSVSGVSQSLYNGGATSNYDYYLGTGYASSWPGGVGWDFFNGQIDEAAVYNSALTPAQVAAHFAARTVAAPVTLDVNTVAPVPAVSGPTEGAPQLPLAFTFSATDVSLGDTLAGFDYAIDWGDFSPFDISLAHVGNLDLMHTYTSYGTYFATLTVVDDDGGVGVLPFQVDIVPVLQVGNDIVAGGLDGMSNRIIFSAASGGNVIVRWENSDSLSGNVPKVYGPFTPLPGGKLIAFGGDGDDTITVSNLAIPVEFHGEEGNDYLAGGTVDDSLFGDAGNDRLLGGYGNDLIDGGDDNDSVDAGYGDDVVFGGSGNDTLLGGVGDDVISGGEGTDGLTGSNGRDILLGGDGKDSLSGGNDEDVLASGLTAYDSYSDPNFAALQALLAEWTSGNSYATRIANLKSGGGAAAGNMLDPGSNVTNDDGYNDILKGAAGNDWFLASTAVSGINKDTTDRVLATETLN